MPDHHHHRPHRLSVPPRVPISTPSITSRSYPQYPYSSSTPTPTPSKQRLSSFSSINYKSNNSNSISSLFLILFSLRSFYSLLPFLRSSPSFSLFPFSFLVSFLSFLLTFSFSLFSFSPKYPFQKHYSKHPIFSFSSITQSQISLLFAKSVLLAVVFLLRFQGLRYCGTAATILAELSGNVAGRFVSGTWWNRNDGIGSWNYTAKINQLSVSDYTRSRIWSIHFFEVTSMLEASLLTMRIELLMRNLELPQEAGEDLAER